MISIVLPNLNTPLNFLEERVKSILQQTFIHWNCIIIDGFSSNGSAEYLKQICEEDNRFTFYERPKKGIYDAWNEGIKLATHPFVYIATSDDTMLPELLEAMLEELMINVDCGIAQCGLIIIDENNNAYNGKKWDDYWTSQYLGSLIRKKHKRLAPHDGILHMGVQTVYTSITQLLIRKSLFDDIGLFLTDGGSIADFEWGMRATLLTNTIYIPKMLATWRIHNLQATSVDYNDSAEHRNNICMLANKALSVYKEKDYLAYKKLNIKKLFYVFRRDQFYYELVSEKYRGKKIAFLYKWARLYMPILIDYLLFKLKLKSEQFDRLTYIKKYIDSMKIDNNIIILP